MSVGFERQRWRTTEILRCAQNDRVGWNDKVSENDRLGMMDGK
jgi:hypothetical protein